MAIGEQRQPAQAELELGGRSSGYNMRTGTRFLIRVYIQVLTWAGPIVSSYGKKRPSGCVQSRNGPSIERLKKRKKTNGIFRQPTVPRRRPGPKSDRCEERPPFPFSPPRSRRRAPEKLFRPLSNRESSGNYQRTTSFLGKRGTRRNPSASRSTGAVDSTGARRRELLSASSFSLLLDPLLEIDLIPPVLVNPSSPSLPFPNYFFALACCDVNS